MSDLSVNLMLVPAAVKIFIALRIVVFAIFFCQRYYNLLDSVDRETIAPIKQEWIYNVCGQNPSLHVCLSVDVRGDTGC